MLQQKEFKQYQVHLDTYSKNYVESLIKLDELDYQFNKELAKEHLINAFDILIKEMDCTIIHEDNTRALQTINYRYRVLVSSTVYVLNKLIELDVDITEQLSKCLEIHNKNIEFEKINPPIIYGGKQVKEKKVRQKKSKSSPVEEVKVEKPKPKFILNISKFNIS